MRALNARRTRRGLNRAVVLGHFELEIDLGAAISVSNEMCAVTS